MFCNICNVLLNILNWILSVFINDGRFNGKQIIKKSTNQLIFKNQLVEEFNTSIGLVFGITRKEDTWFNKDGIEGVLHWGGYWNTSFFADPNNKIVGIIFKQTQNTNENSVSKFYNAIYEILN